MKSAKKECDHYVVRGPMATWFLNKAHLQYGPHSGHRRKWLPSASATTTDDILTVTFSRFSRHSFPGAS